jgi:hypothetical protein
MATDPPIFVNCRDRVDDLRRLVAWLERAGHQRITLIDNDSSYQPLLDYYRDTPHEVFYLDTNLGSRALWLSGTLSKRLGEHYVYTDPDVVPIDECPYDAITRLREVLDCYSHRKAGLGLYLTDVPPFQSMQWERSLVAANRLAGKLGDVQLFDSLVDTTLALYKPLRYNELRSLQTGGSGLHAIRTGYPMQMRHMPWYRLGSPTAEERFYLARASSGPQASSWAEGRQ